MPCPPTQLGSLSPPLLQRDLPVADGATVGVMGLPEDIKASKTLPTSREVCGLVGAQWDQILRCLVP